MQGLPRIGPGHEHRGSLAAASPRAALDVSISLGGSGLVAFRLGRHSQVVREAMRQQAAEIAMLKDEIKDLSKLVTAVTVASKRLDILEQCYDELRHGEGFVFPLARHLRAAPAK